jgi:hypothetical protein
MTIAIFPWLAPAPIYFALFRYDIYPALATVMALFAIRRDAFIQGALWLGIAASLKGYALFLLPAYCVFIGYQRNLSAAVQAGVIFSTPMILSLIATLFFAGWEGAVAPFKFHLARLPNSESSYAAFTYAFHADMISWIHQVSWIAPSLQIASAIAAAAMRPRRFEDLVHCFLFAVLGFISFSKFYSPQFLLWVLPLVSFSTSRIMVISAIIFSWLTFLYFPISFDLQPTQPWLFEVTVGTISILRLFMMFVAAKIAISPDKFCLKSSLAKSESLQRSKLL